MSKEKLTVCKACGAEVAKSAKSCPSCGAKIKKTHPILIGVIVVLLLIIVIGAVGGTDEPTYVEGNNGTTAENPKNDKKTVFGLNETAELRDVRVTMQKVTESNGSKFNQPSDGNIFVLFRFEITNNSKEEINISSMLCFDAYCDEYACSYSLSAMMEKGEENQLDGTVAPGKKMKGVIGYEVPADWAKMEIRFVPNIWNGKEIVFLYTK